MQAPRVEKITLNMGVGDAKQDSKLLDAATEQLATIAGQKPSVRRARKSIATFKLREGMPVGVAVTLRGERMYEFLDRLMSIAIPRIRDFRGLNPRSFDGRGNYSMGIREQIIFPEIDYDAIDQVRGLDVTITTSAATDERGLRAAAGARHAVLAGAGPTPGLTPRRRGRGRGAAAAERAKPPRSAGPAPPRRGGEPRSRRRRGSRRRRPHGARGRGPAETAEESEEAAQERRAARRAAEDSRRRGRRRSEPERAAEATRREHD